MRRLPIRELRAGMVLERDVFEQDGNLLILKEGTILTETWIERLENFAKARGAAGIDRCSCSHTLLEHGKLGRGR